jgi:Uma2 family endonuclease
MLPKIREYLELGVEWVWLIDPEKRQALCFSPQDPAGGPCDVLRTENPAIEIPLETVLAGRL